ncbi:class I SAM-dependent methyltransferase [Streptomyces iranensis]|uniref:Methyltransferase domain-containing protein n=1 Tax=Streptomyces iranensis TaxID=576784 RepID=A0ABS4N0Y2_9ACTN|nr:methyltransferase domain-containing protein [Streptomyces iranensis]MBP2065087.1 hypothetical protein [Streptomyces iranensis]
MPRESTTLPEYWDTYKPYREEGEQPTPDVETFAWTQYDGHGPGEEFLGSPRIALELGCAEGKEAVYLARTGVAVTALDFSAAQVARARRWWDGTPGLTFVQAEACGYLGTTEPTTARSRCTGTASRAASSPSCAGRTRHSGGPICSSGPGSSTSTPVCSPRPGRQTSAPSWCARALPSEGWAYSRAATWELGQQPTGKHIWFALREPLTE